ncbi:MAG TPA: hypothetical protein VED02_00750 [Methyloceanibacter sp.]|nr:hypothetical protein [Methyloceanibacter sp.]
MVFEYDAPVPVAISPQSVTVESLGAVHLAVADNILTAGVEDRFELRFNLMGAVRARQSAQQGAASFAPEGIEQRPERCVPDRQSGRELWSPISTSRSSASDWLKQIE